ncbi:MAG TPA: preprotein translocase subunit SecG, partial [Balneolaceae bacterium]|nr:preprotein translocase subunit SecG [Balneolaceae bacterium]
AGGMAGGGGLGARRTADLLSKSTTVLGTALLALCLLANFAIERGGPTESAVQQSGVEVPVQQNGLDGQSQTPSAVPLPEENQSNGSNTDTGDGN